MLSKKILRYASSLKILYVEDHKEIREMMMRILEDIFGEIRIAVDGKDGLEKFYKEEFALIISDINMPKLNGIEMLKIIRKDDKKIPILILSAHTDSEYFMETIRLGVEGYLLKPIEIDQFAFIIEKTLEKIILEEERQYYEEELKRSNRQLQLSTKAKDEFLANMSHEIRSPMNAIIGLSYILSQSDLTEKQEDYVDKIHTSGNLLLGIINDILDFSKIEAGKLDIEHIDFNLNTVLSNVSNIVSNKAKEKELELIFDIDSNLPSSFRGDPVRLGQVIINIMNNAIKFTKEGEVSLHVSAQEFSSEKEIVKFEIIDTGIGIEKERLEYLFDSFTQADNSISRNYGGSGLGLSISKNLVELMGGHIEIQSEYGEGSHCIFSIEFEPIVHEEVIPYLPDTLIAKKVLIINTNLYTSQVLSKILNDIVFEILSVSIIEDARSILEEKKFDIIYIEKNLLLDTIAERISHYQKAKIILFESALDFENDVYYNDIAVNSQLEKPFYKEMVVKSLLESLEEDSHKKLEKETLEKENFNTINTNTILLVEDNKINQAVILGLLKETNLNVIVANNGQESVDILRKENQIKLILMDINMPVMNGYEATKIIREGLGYSTLPIIAITAGAMQKNIDDAKAAGMQDHLAKPIDVNEFKSILLKYLEHKEEKNQENFPVKSESSLSVLDTHNALNQIGGDKGLYKSILQDFKLKYKDIGIRLGHANKEKNYKVGQLLCNDLKGISGTIGASILQSKAREFEKAFKNEEPNAELLYKIIFAYQELIEEIDKYLKT